MLFRSTGVETGYLILIPLLPLIGFAINGLGWLFARERWSRPVVNTIAVATVAGSFVLSVKAFFDLAGLEQGAYLVQNVFTWIDISPKLEGMSGLIAPFKLVFDRLTAVMCLVVTGVGGLIHLYSTGYMAHDKAFARFFAYLNLFTFAMLTLVMGGNIILLFVGWEGVGLCSYLLIGFWYEDPEKASAGKKAFVVNRIGDFGFLVGIFGILWLTHTLDFHEMQEWFHLNAADLAKYSFVGIPIATFIALSLFVGATGKSAQIPLYVWLPDAMAGPTPVSALIHAATMVTAGVYMIGRLNFIFINAPTAMMVVAGIGVATALFSATIGLTQNDIKKVLAYSTVSQLGFMFIAMGVGAFAAGIFHLVTHAFFKALLFLGAGSVIHGMSGEQDMRKMGGLKDKMPKTFWTMTMAWIAICGIAPFAGFVSKDEILWKAFSAGGGFGKLVYVVGLAAAVLTATYMTRLMYLTFFTPSRIDHEVERHVHESPWNMTVPLMALATLSVFGGFLNWPAALGGGAHFERWLAPIWVSTSGHAAHHGIAAVEYGLMGLSVGVALAAILLTRNLYLNHMAKTGEIAERAGWFYQASLNKYWVDEIYSAMVVEPIKTISWFFLFRVVDVNIVDGIANGIGNLTKRLAEAGKRLQTGVAQTYALYMALGLLAVLAYFFSFR